ncbi:MAG: hypothetical protein ACREBJ_01650 [Nitrosotalea sp.]
MPKKIAVNRLIFIDKPIKPQKLEGYQLHLYEEKETPVYYKTKKKKK